MATRVLYRHGPLTGQVAVIADDTYAESLLATGYAVALKDEAPVDQESPPEPPAAPPPAPAPPSPPAEEPAVEEPAVPKRPKRKA